MWPKIIYDRLLGTRIMMIGYKYSYSIIAEKKKFTDLKFLK